MSLHPVRTAFFIPAAMVALAGAAHGASLVRPAETGHGALDAALRSMPATKAHRAAHWLEHTPMCFPSDLTPDQWQAIIDDWAMLPPSAPDVIDPAERFFTDNPVWTGNGLQGLDERAIAAHLTYSFPDDGVIWGLSAVSATGPNDLNANLMSAYGDLDRGRELIRQSLAGWRRYCGLTYQEVADNNSPMDQSTATTSARGDIRIGGRGFGTSSFLAYNAFPSASGASGVGGGDMCINTSFFLPANFNDPQSNFRYFRNTIAHEHGHGTGNFHVIPCSSSKLMEPAIQLGVDVLAIDDRRGGGRSYGDRFSGNYTANDAHHFGNLTNPVVRSVIERDLSTNGANALNGSGNDYFRFTLSTAQQVIISADPTGGTYQNGEQFFSCFGFESSVNAEAAGNLNIQLLDATGANLLQQAASAGAGQTENLNAGTLPAGTYTVRIFDNGPNSSANQIVQLYDLTIRVDNAKAPPLAIAGVNKRIGANVDCHFMGDINSAPTDSGSSLNNSSFDWDLDGDGVFETNNDPQPEREYVSNGVYDVTLRVTDNFGMESTDTITVTVFGATTDVADVLPDVGDQGQTIPVTITGVNLKNVTAAHVSVSGGGVSVIGLADPNTEGTEVTGLSFQIDAGAATGVRNVTVSNSDGSDTLVGAFTINAGAPPCPADLNGDMTIDFSDLNILLGNFNQTGFGLPGDLDGDGDVDFADLNALLTVYNTDCP